MSRIGKKPVTIPAGITVAFNNNVVTAKGPKGELSQEITGGIEVKIEDSVINVVRPTDQKRHKSLHGLYRALISNMIEGVQNGYKHQLELVGVGFKAEVRGDLLVMDLGYSHNVYFQIPAEVKCQAESKKGTAPIVTLESADKQLIGQVSAKLKSLRKVEPFKGKGIKFVGENIRRKAGKTAAK